MMIVPCNSENSEPSGGVTLSRRGSGAVARHEAANENASLIFIDRD